MTLQASKTKILDDAKAMSFHFVASLANYILVIAAYSLQFIFPKISTIKTCVDPEASLESGLLFIIIMTWLTYIVWIGIGIYHDLSLIKIMKKKNRQTNSELVSWKSSTKEVKLGVPIRATLISTILMAIIGISGNDLIFSLL